MSGVIRSGFFNGPLQRAFELIIEKKCRHDDTVAALESFYGDEEYHIVFDMLDALGDLLFAIDAKTQDELGEGTLKHIGFLIMALTDYVQGVNDIKHEVEKIEAAGNPSKHISTPVTESIQ